MTAWIEEDDFQLARQVVTSQLEEGGPPAMTDLALGLAQLCHLLLCKYEIRHGITMRESLQAYAEIFTGTGEG